MHVIVVLLLVIIFVLPMDFSEHVNKYGYSIDPFIGHGVGTIFHSEPIIWHTYDYEPGFMVAGQTFTIGKPLPWPSSSR
uniref:Uncharacterized protein n=1 Tax=Aegilops tauschii subsp. strangulata TaxID=200361 RepID=A0A453P0R1_AEGTS